MKPLLTNCRYKWAPIKTRKLVYSPPIKSPASKFPKQGQKS